MNRAWGDCQASSYGTSTTKEKATQSKAKRVVQSLPSIDCPSILLCDMNNHLLLPPGLFSLAHFGSPFARSTAISPSERCLSYCPLIFATTGARSLNNVFWQQSTKRASIRHRRLLSILSFRGCFVACPLGFRFQLLGIRYMLGFVVNGRKGKLLL